MKKKLIVLGLVAAVAAVSPLSALAASVSPDTGTSLGTTGSSSSSGGGGGSSSSSSSSTTGSSASTTTTSSSTNDAGDLAVSTVITDGSGDLGITEDGHGVTMGTVVTDEGVTLEVETILQVVNGAADKVNDLSTEVQTAIAQIDAGVELSEISTGLDLTGYNALATSTTIITVANLTGNEVISTARTPLYVPNLIDGIGQISALFYSTWAGQWMILPATSIDYANKTVWFDIPGTGNITVMYNNN